MKKIKNPSTKLTIYTGRTMQIPYNLITNNPLTKMPQLIACLLTAGLLLLTQGCGFHLRNQSQLPPSLRVMTLQSYDPYGSFTKQLAQTLRAYGATLITPPAHAPVTLEILRDKFSKQATSISATAQLTQYILMESMSFQIRNAQGQVIEGPLIITTTRNYTATFNQMLGATNDEELLKQEMQRDTIYQLFNRLSTLKSFSNSPFNSTYSNSPYIPNSPKLPHSP
jgi:LPS-assembly lipoprotein